MAQPESRPAEVRHRHETRLQLLLPMFLVGLLLLGCVAIVLAFPRRLQVGIVADIMLIVLMLCPAVICMLPLALGMLVAAFGMNKVHDGLARPMRQVAELSNTLTERTAVVTDTVNQKTIDVSARFGGIYKLLSIFESKDEIPDGADTEVE